MQLHNLRIDDKTLKLYIYNMSYLLSPLNVYKHKITSGEVEKMPSQNNSFKICIDNIDIHKTRFTDLIVNGSNGLEPAYGYSQYGNGSVFHDIQIEDGHAEMIIKDCRNQSVTNPVGLKLIFVS